MLKTGLRGYDEYLNLLPCLFTFQLLFSLTCGGIEAPYLAKVASMTIIG
jgi:hypothetical protein